MIIWIVYLASFIFLGNANEPRKIVGGEITTILNFPHVVSIQHNNKHLCGGTIITSYYILTTATCVLLEEINAYYAGLEIFSGSSDLFDYRRTASSAQINHVQLIIHHEDFSARNFWIHDIAILKLLEPIYASVFHQGAILPSSDYRKSKLTTAGWGDKALETDSGSSHYLRKLKITELSQENCESYYGALHETQGCAEAISKGSHITTGDGGSPLTSCKRVIGIVSINSVNLNDAPFIFTRVNPYNSWIKKMVGIYTVGKRM